MGEDKYLKKLESIKSKINNAPQISNSATSKKQNTSNKAYDRIKKNAGYGFTETDVNAWSSSVNDVLKRAEQYLSTDGYRVADRNIESEIKKLINDTDSVSNFLHSNGKYIENYDDIFNSVGETKKALSAYLNGVRSMNDVFSQYASEDDYNKALSGWLNEEAEITPENAKARQERYEANLNRIEELKNDPYLQNKIAPNNPNTLKNAEVLAQELMSIGKDAFEKKYGGLYEEYERLIAENNQYKRTQYGIDRNYIPITDEVANIAANRKYSYDDDKLGAYLASDDEYVENSENRYLANIRNENRNVAGGMQGWDALTDDEITRYYYIYNTQGKDAAYQYLEDMTPILTRRSTKNRAEELSNAEWYEQILTNIASVPMSLVGGIAGTIGDVVNLVTGNDLNPYDAAHALSNDASAIRQDTAKDIDEALGGASIPWLDFSAGDAYSAMMSIGDSVVSSFIPGGSALLGLGAAQSTMKDIYDRGGSTSQMLASGIMAGVAESFFEKFSIGELDKIKKMDKASVKGLVDVFVRGTIMGGVEASEEMATEIVNTLTDSIVMGSQSNWTTPEEFLKNVLNAGIGGFLSGGATGSAATLVKYVGKKIDDSKVGKDINNIGLTDKLLTEAGTLKDSGKLVDKYLDKYAEKGKLSNMEAYRLFELTKDAKSKAKTETNLTNKEQALVGNSKGEQNTPKESSVTENAPAKENATEAKFEGATEAELVADIARDKKNTLKGFTEEAESAMVNGYTGEVTPSEYSKAFTNAFEMGARGVPSSALIKSINSKAISERTAFIAYALGQNSNKALQNVSNNGTINSQIKDGGNNDEGIRLRDSSERNGSENSEGQVSAVESGSGQAESRRKTARIADKEAARLLNEGREVKVADLGILGGSKEQTVRVLENVEETESMKKARAEAEASGVKVTFFVGDNLVIEEDGELISARAYITLNGKHVFVRVDHPLYTAEQLMGHELGHYKIHKGEVDINAVRERIKELVDGDYDELAKLYEAAYAGSGYNADQIWEECICDSLGNMNVFAGTETEKFIEAMLPKVKTVAESTAKSPAQTRGAPDTSIYKTGDAKGGWGKKYATAQQALNEAIKVTDSSLYAAFESEVHSGKSHTPITNAIIAVQEDVRQSTITPIQGAKLLSEVYQIGGANALDRIYIGGTGNLYPKVLEKAKQYSTAVSEFAEGKASREFGSYSNEDYNNFGWVRQNNVINAGYWRNFTENFAQAVENLQKYPQTKYGEFMISVYDVYGTSEVADVVVFAKGTIESPIISKIVKIDFTQEIDIEAKRSELYATERKGIRQTSGEVFIYYSKSDFVGKRKYERNSTESNGNNNRLNAKRSRSEIKANPITQFNVNEAENTVTYTYANGETVTESLGKASRELDTDEAYSRIFDMRGEVNALRQSIKEIESSADFKEQMSKLSEAIENDNVDAGVKEYEAWKKASGYGELVAKRDKLQNEIDVLRKDLEDNRVASAKNAEQEAIAKSGLSEADYFRKLANKEFGYTPYFYDAGYILPNGKMLNFSGEKGKHFGTRGEDHRAIGIIYANTQGTDALVRFMNDGNIRIMAESPGLDISSNIEPSKEQYSTIRSFIYQYANKEYFNIDLSDENGRVIGSLEYDGRINPTRIINDLKHYYETGEIREQSSVDKYRFSRELDTEYLSAVERGDMETAQRMVDEAAKKAGYSTEHLYHGTSMFGFTNIDVSSASDDSISFFATNRQEVASGYMPWYEDDASDLHHDDVRRIGVPDKSRPRGLSRSYSAERILTEAQKVFPEYKDARVATDAEILADLKTYWLEETIEAAEKLREIELSIGSNKLRQQVRDMCDAVIAASKEDTLDAWKAVGNRYKEFDSVDIPYDANDMRPQIFRSRILGGLQQIGKFSKTTAIMLNGQLTSTASIVDSYNSFLGGETLGMYDLYTKQGKQLVIQGRGSGWNHLPLGKHEAEYREWLGGDASSDSASERVTTRDVAAFAKAKGYRSVAFFDIYDNGAYGSAADISDVYAFFHPNEDVKSADPVTYDDNGKVVPLSERFNTEKSDIRFSRELEIMDLINEQAGEKREADNTKQQNVAKARDDLEKLNVGKGEIMALMKLADEMYDNYNGQSTISDFRYGLFETTKVALNGIDEGLEAAYNIIHTLAREVAYNPKRLTGEAVILDSIQKQIKGTRMSVSDADKTSGEFTEYGGYNEFRKRHLGKFILANEGTKVDVQYQELQKLYGKGYFPEVNTISEMLLRMAEIVDMPLSEYMAESETELDSIADGIAVTLFERLGDVWSKISRRGKVVINKTAIDQFSNRTLLANALETVVQNEVEAKKLEEYKANIDKMNAEQAKLNDLRAQIKEISFSKGKRDTEKLKALQEEATKTANRITVYDGKLLKLEATKALKDVLEREKLKAYRSAAQKGRERLHENVEGRRKTEARHKIMNVTRDLDALLNRGTKERNVKIDLQDLVSSVLDISERLFATDEELIVAGIETDMTSAEKDAVSNYLDLYAEYHSYDDAVTENKEKRKEIRSEMNELKKELAGVLERERNRINEAKASAAYDSLLKAFEELRKSDLDYISAAIENVPEAYEYIKTLKEKIGKKLVKDMTLDELDSFYKAVKAVKHIVSNANKIFGTERKESLKELGEKAHTEISKVTHKKYITAAEDAMSMMSWNNLKPVYLMERLKSDTLVELFADVLEGESQWARDAQDAHDFAKEQKDKFHYKDWDLKELHKFTSNTGQTYELSLEQMLAIYAYVKRGEDSLEHLRNGGFVFGKIKRKKEDGKVEYILNDKTAYKVPDTVIFEIIGNPVNGDKGILTAEQKAYVDAMQGYLSSVMGANGNEVSRQLYGIDLFTEENYMPMHSEEDFLEKARMQEEGKTKIKNKGFTKPLQKGSNNPLVLEDFTDVWGSHVAEMASYHAMALPLENLGRVLNYQNKTSQFEDKQSLRTAVGNAFGDAAKKALDQLIDDINGGARVDVRESVGKKIISLHKKAKVMLSLSVAIQQPTSVLRAMALIDPKYFAGTPKFTKKHWNELKQYAPVAIIKEMGRFDTGMGKSSSDWITGKTSWRDTADTISGWLPERADMVTWINIWNAVKRETASKNPTMNTNSEEFLRLAGKRFEEIIRYTQVYDSTLSRSSNMRSKSGWMQMVTSFLAEPTTSLNMREAALRSGNKKRIARTTAAIYSAAILNAILVAIPYAMRDDDEDETLLEKYASAVGSSFLSNINPITAMPFFRDIWSLSLGYDVERSDMSLASDLLDSSERLVREMIKDEIDSAAIITATHKLLGDVSALLDIPIGNLYREANALVNAYNTASRDVETTLESVLDELYEMLQDETPIWSRFPGETRGDKLYNAILEGDDAYVERLKGYYKSDSAVDTAIRTALKKHDERIEEAAKALFEGERMEYDRILSEIVDEGYFTEKNVMAAILQEYEAMQPEEEEKEESAAEKEQSRYKVIWVLEDLLANDTDEANAMQDDIIATHISNGKSEKEAKSAFNSSFKSELKDYYLEDRVNASTAIKMLMSYAGKSEAEAFESIQYWDFKKKYTDSDLTESQVTKYYATIDKLGKSPSSLGISVAQYEDALDKISEATGVDKDGDGKADKDTKKKEVISIINSLPISKEQKDALYYLNYSGNIYKDTPWR